MDAEGQFTLIMPRMDHRYLVPGVAVEPKISPPGASRAQIPPPIASRALFHTDEQNLGRTEGKEKPPPERMFEWGLSNGCSIDRTFYRVNPEPCARTEPETFGRGSTSYRRAGSGVTGRE